MIGLTPIAIRELVKVGYMREKIEAELKGTLSETLGISREKTEEYNSFLTKYLVTDKDVIDGQECVRITFKTIDFLIDAWNSNFTDKEILFLYSMLMNVTDTIRETVGVMSSLYREQSVGTGGKIH